MHDVHLICEIQLPKCLNPYIGSRVVCVMECGATRFMVWIVTGTKNCRWTMNLVYGSQTFMLNYMRCLVFADGFLFYCKVRSCVEALLNLNLNLNLMHQWIQVILSYLSYPTDNIGEEKWSLYIAPFVSKMVMSSNLLYCYQLSHISLIFVILIGHLVAGNEVRYSFAFAVGSSLLCAEWHFQFYYGRPIRLGYSHICAEKGR